MSSNGVILANCVTSSTRIVIEAVGDSSPFGRAPSSVDDRARQSLAVCPQYALDDSFVGPAALALAHRYNLDSRDVGRSAREDVVASNAGIWECSFVGACSEVCPKSVDPAAAIQQMKIVSTSDYFMKFLMPWKRR